MDGYNRNIKLSKYQEEILSLAVLNNGVIKPDDDLYILHTGKNEKRINVRTVNVLLEFKIIKELEDGSFIFDESVFNFYMNQQMYKEIKPFYYEGVLIEPTNEKLSNFAETNEKFPFSNWKYTTFLDETSLTGCSNIDVFKVDNRYYKPDKLGCFRLLEI